MLIDGELEEKCDDNDEALTFGRAMVEKHPASAITIQEWVLEEEDLLQ